ncbi:hypothetical protein H2204_006803 [Knufia peltigerae]|uniref:AB hydrolase-1 domain-containing protein n=1 Tax=Knufia peltigerae TaxID=1002370 RepID=A0AA39CYF8_9EURO|nr:hypothetical protein H2204_006803 [Knufia peltigerae]
MATRSSLEYTPLPPRAQEVVSTQLFLSEDSIKDEIARFADVKPRPTDHDGDTEVLEGVTFTHNFILGPGDGEVIQWHYVEAGRAQEQQQQTIVFLHGIPDAWYQWHMQMAYLSQKGFRCIAPDLKGYGQSDKSPGDYRHEGVGEQLHAMLELIQPPLGPFNIVTHDRGTCQADHIVANHPGSVLRYARGEQHLYHFHPSLAPQGDLFMNAPYNGILDDARKLIVWAHLSLGTRPIPEDKLIRSIQEFSYADINKAVPRYFNSSSFRSEWLIRRNVLLAKWKCPVLILQGYDSKTQPREFYGGVSKKEMPNAKSVDVQFVKAGHFWALEAPQETAELLERFFQCPL